MFLSENLKSIVSRFLETPSTKIIQLWIDFLELHLSFIYNVVINKGSKQKKIEIRLRMNE